MNYSKMMTIIENAKVKLDKEEDIKEATDFFLHPAQDKSCLPSLRQRLRERQEKLFKQRSRNVDAPKKIEALPFKRNSAVIAQMTQMKDSSILLLNSSSFEIDSQAIKARSVSMVLKEKDSFDSGSETPWAREKQEYNQHSFMGLTPSEKDLIIGGAVSDRKEEPSDRSEEEEKKAEEAKVPERVEKERDKAKKLSYLRRTADQAAKSSKNIKKIVINKRFAFWDEQGVF